MGVVEWVTRSELIEVLSKPIPPHVAVSFPVSGKKAILPTARWGAVATDAHVIDWSARNFRQVKTALVLREMGVGEPALAEDSPPYYLLSKTDPSQHAEIKRLWRILEPARKDKTMLPFIQKISRKDKP